MRAEPRWTWTNESGEHEDSMLKYVFPQVVRTLKAAASTAFSLRKLCRMSIRDSLGRASRGTDIRPLVGQLEGHITKDALDFILNV